MEITWLSKCDSAPRACDGYYGCGILFRGTDLRRNGLAPVFEAERAVIEDAAVPFIVKFERHNATGAEFLPLFKSRRKEGLVFGCARGRGMRDGSF